MKKIYVAVFCDSVLGVFDDLNKAKTFYVKTNGDCGGWILEFSLQIHCLSQGHEKLLQCF